MFLRTKRFASLLPICLGILLSSSSLVSAATTTISFDDPGDGVTVVDGGDNDVGVLQSGAVFDTQNPPCLESGAANTSYADFRTDGFALINLPFALHDPSVAGGSGDATVEWLMNSEPGQTHSSIFWTNGGGSDHRYNIFWDTSPHNGPTDSIAADYGTDGPTTQIVPFGSPALMLTSVWQHVAIRREAIVDIYSFELWVDGQLHSTVETPDNLLPNSNNGFLVAGREGGAGWRGLFDELILHDEAVDPASFNLVCPPVCPQGADPDNGDTHCLSVTVDPAPNDPPPPAGFFTVTVNASDDTNDSIIYIIQVEDSFGTIINTTIQSSPEIRTLLPEGSYTIRASVDDDPQCPDEASDAACAEVLIDVGPPPPFAAYVLSFENDGIPGDLLSPVTDDLSGLAVGALKGATTFSDDAAPLTGGRPNNVSVAVGGGGIVMTNTFIFHDAGAGGAQGDATQQWFQKTPLEGQPHTSIFWTRPDDTDANRFNIYYNANFSGLPGSEDFVNGDQRNPTGAIGDIGVVSGGVQLPRNEWFSVAITRTEVDPGGDGVNPTYEWNWYINGNHNPNQTTTTNLIQPTSVGWQIAGRGGFDSAMLLDEIQGIGEVLDPADLTTVNIECPPAGDTVCLSLDIDPLPDDPPPPAGRFTLFADGDDASGDTVLYRYVFDNLSTPANPDFVVGPTEDSQITVTLAEGAWDISVEVDDQLLCTDVAPGNSCQLSIDVGPSDPFPSEALINFEDGGNGGAGGIGLGTAVIESVSGATVGQLVDGAIFTADAPNLNSGATNDFAADCNVGRIVIDGLPFILNSESSGGAPGDASLEWLMKVPDQPHTTIFWSNGDTDADGNRYNIFWNAEFANSSATQVVSGDANPGGGIGIHANGVQVPVDIWNHHAIVRTTADAGLTFTYEWYVNGQLNESQTSTIASPLPNSLTWEIMSRSGAPSTRGLIDEIRMVTRALAIPEMNVVSRDCPADGDTTCDQLQIAPPPGDPAPPAGTFSLFVNATDGSDDAPLFYTFRGSLNGGPFNVLGSGNENLIEVALSSGDWDIEVTVDDDLFCSDVVAGGGETCSLSITVGPRPPFADTTLRFEDAGGGDVNLLAGAVIGTDVPSATVPLTGEANTGSLDTLAGGYASVVSSAFVFHDPNFGGAPSDATLEWYFKVPAGTGHASMFFTTNTDLDDNRFNIFWNVNGNDVVAGDFHSPAPGPRGNVIGVFDNGNLSAPDEWHHVAIVRTEVGGGNGGANGPVDPTFEWTWYIDGLESPGHFSTTTASAPTSVGWLVSGRQNASAFPGNIDEVRMTGSALASGQFLIDGGVIGTQFRRGDHDGSGVADITDALNLLGFLFLGSTPPICGNASDFDNSGALDITDALILLGHLFLGQPNALPAPGTSCGLNPDTPQPGIPPIPPQAVSDLGCETYPGPAFPGAACP